MAGEPPSHARKRDTRVLRACRGHCCGTATWQQFAREVAGILTCAKCAAPNSRRRFLRSVGRADRQYCSPTCRMHAWRSATFSTPAGSP